MMIIQFADQRNLRHVLSSNFNNILWKDNIHCIYLFYLLTLYSILSLFFLEKKIKLVKMPRVTKSKIDQNEHQRNKHILDHSNSPKPPNRFILYRRQKQNEFFDNLNNPIDM